VRAGLFCKRGRCHVAGGQRAKQPQLVTDDHECGIGCRAEFVDDGAEQLLELLIIDHHNYQPFPNGLLR
jgi:hypothetical protein